MRQAPFWMDSPVGPWVVTACWMPSMVAAADAGDILDLLVGVGVSAFVWSVYLHFAHTPRGKDAPR